jgi:hypothetical protein
VVAKRSIMSVVLVEHHPANSYFIDYCSSSFGTLLYDTLGLSHKFGLLGERDCYYI